MCAGPSAEAGDPSARGARRPCSATEQTNTEVTGTNERCNGSTARPKKGSSFVT